MKYALITLILSLGLFVTSYASTVQDCMGMAKMFQNPSAMAGAANMCMQTHFTNLKSTADACRTEAKTKTVPQVSDAACHATLVIGLMTQINDCKKEATSLLQGKSEGLQSVKQGARLGCKKLAEHAAAICQESAATFEGISQKAAVSVCEQVRI